MDSIEKFKLNSDYQDFLSLNNELEYDELVQKFSNFFPAIWTKSYKTFGHRLTDICIISCNSFHYIFDDSPSGYEEYINDSVIFESRIVAVFGTSSPQFQKRDDGRLRGWIGKTETIYGKSWDKGHYIAHSIGGTIDKTELNVYPQKRALNRGWSPQGKIYRKMEKYCSDNKNVFCFNRPIYLDETFRPAFLEFGVLMNDKHLWIEQFDNR